MKRTQQQALGALAFVLSLALLIPASRAAAHAGYDHSTPGADEVVQQQPARVDVYFGQEVFRQAGANFVRVFNDQDAQVSTGDGTVDDDDRTHIFADVEPDLPAGRYIVRWQTLSDEDGDSADGAFCFYIQVQPTAGQQAECASFAPQETPAPTQAEASPTAGGATPTTAAETPAASPSPTPVSDGGGGGGSNTGAIVAGVIVGVIAAVVVVGGAAIWLRRMLA